MYMENVEFKEDCRTSDTHTIDYQLYNACMDTNTEFLRI